MVDSQTTQNVQNLRLSSAVPLTLADRRLFNYLLLNAFEKLPKQNNFVIALQDLEGVYGSGAPPVNLLQESLRRLIRTLIEFETASRQWIVTSLLDNAELDKKEKQLYYSYSEHCSILFTNSLILEQCLIQAHFNLKYSNLLYEILAPIHYDKQQKFSVAITDLRNRLEIPDNKLINFNDFDRFVLIPALKEINSYASFAVKSDTQRKGMKVTHVIFEMTSKRNISDVESAKQVIPPKRPRFFIDNPELERAYAYLLNVDTKERRKYFDKACKLAAKKKHTIDEEAFDRPDLWFRWVESELLKRNK